MSDKQKTQLKICGFTRAEDLQAACACGVDWFGINFYPGSKRYVTPALAANLLTKAGWSDFFGQGAGLACPAGLVAILVDPDDALLTDVMAQLPGLQVIQLHGRESPARVSQIRSRLAPHQQIWKAMHVGTAADVARWHEYEPVCDLLLFDSAQIATGHRVPGGSGQTFSWDSLSAYQGTLPFGLAGGITLNNIKDALAFRLQGRSALVIDIASGAENGIPGTKDIAKIRAMVAAVKETL